MSTLKIKEPIHAFAPYEKLKILLLRQDRIGDVLISSPFVELLRKNLPAARIDILLGHRNSGARRAIEKHVDNILVYDKKIIHTLSLLGNIRRTKYDVTVDLLDNASRTSSIIVKKSLSRFSLGFDKENSGIYTHVVPLPDKHRVHIVDRTARLLWAFGINPDDKIDGLFYPIEETEKQKALALTGKKEKRLRLGINLSGSDRAKFWGIDNNRNFISALLANYDDIEIFVFGTKDYENDKNEIIRGSKARKAPEVHSFHEFACLLSTCDLIMTPDTSAVHLAAAWKAPCLALYKYDPEGAAGMPWTPYKSPYKALTTSGESIESITVESALGAFDELYHLL